MTAASTCVSRITNSLHVKQHPHILISGLASICLAASLITTWPAAPVQAGEPQPAKTESAEQLWFGTMTIKDVRQFRFVLMLTKRGDNWSGKIKSLDEGAREFEMTDIERTESRFGFQLRQTAAVYEGVFKEGGGSIEGKWKQGGGELDLAFRRVEQPPSRGVKSVWKGRLNTPIQKLDVAFVELDSGAFIFDSITQKVGGFLAKNESKQDEVIYRVPAVGGTFQGRYTDDKSQIVGKWSQGGAQIDLVLKEAVAGDLSAKQVSRPQMPRAPFPYDSQEVTFSSKNEQVTLRGTLTAPRGRISAGVVLISGSGPQDRDETLLDHKPFWVIADYFARRGIATLRYDDRGVGRSEGDFTTATSFDFADDAEGALEHLRSLPGFEKVPVGLCGHSEGGLIAPIVAARNEHAAFIVMMAGTGVNGEEILYNQSRLLLEAAGIDEKQIESQAKFQRALLSTVVKHIDASPDDLESKVTETLKSVFSAVELAENGFAKNVKAGVAQVASPWFRTFLTLEPRDALSKVKCPALVINGEKDLQVDPRLNLPAIRAALQKAGNKQFEIVEYPGLNHLFQTCKTGSVSEYQDIEETFNEKPLAKMTEWIIGLESGS